jgi:hypothetical protein
MRDMLGDVEAPEAEVTPNAERPTGWAASIPLSADRLIE